MRNLFFTFVLFFVTLPLQSAEYFLNDQPVSCLVNQEAVELCSLKMTSGNDDDVASITMDNYHIQVKWGKLGVDYNSLGREKEEIGSGVVSCSSLTVSSFTDIGGLLGLENSNFRLKTHQGEFKQTSLTFDKTAYITDVNLLEGAFTGIMLKKRSGVTYPLINGILDFSTPGNVIKPLTVDEEGFLIFGCDIILVFNRSLFAK